MLSVTASAHAAGPPLIKSTSFSQVTTTSAVLEAEVDPNGKATKYHFEYGSADCASNPCTSVPTNDSKKEPQIPGSNPATEVTFQLEGLSPGAIYHFRVIAKNSESEKGSPPVVEGPDTVFHTYPIHTFGQCPANDEFRTGKYAPAGHPSAALPDCRAYEQASPVDKSGEDARGIDLAIRSSINGDRATFITTNGIPGGDGGQQLPTYLASRAAGAWTTQGLLPAQSAGNLAGVLGWTPDLGQVFAWAGTARETAGKERVDTNFFSRSSADGSLTTIGPVVTSVPDFAASTPDGSFVLFESNVALPDVPHAVQGSPNLYLWDRSTGQVSLAGVLNNEQPPAQGTFAGSYDWNSGTSAKALNQGGANQHYYTQDNHVLAASGDYLYFTAKGTGRLYVRINPTQPQSAMATDPTTGEEECTEAAKACTIQVSASEKTNGSGDEGRDAAGEAPAAFAAATPDGKKAFLLSSEKLTDDATTGPEPEQPAIARASIDGTGKELTYLSAHAKELAVDSEYVYWSDPEAGTIGRAKIGSPKPTEVKANFIGPLTVKVETEPGHTEALPARPNYLTIHGEYLYWTNDADGKDGHGTIGRAKLTPTGAEEVEPDFITGASNPQGIAIDSEHIYWANFGTVASIGGLSGDPGVPGSCTWYLDGGKRELVRAELNGHNVDTTHWGTESFFCSPPGTGPNGQDLIATIPTQTFRNGPSGSLAITGSKLLTTENAVESTGGEISCLVSLPLAGGEREYFSAETCDDHEHGALDPKAGIYDAVVADSAHAYFSHANYDEIGRFDLPGIPPSGDEQRFDFITNAGHPLGLAVDPSETHLYWAANQGGANPGTDLYRFEPDAPAGQRLTDLSIDPADVNGAEVRGLLGTSEDGSHVYFAANGVLTGSPNDAGEIATTGDCRGAIATEGACQTNLYLSRPDPSQPGQSEIVFIARLSGADKGNWRSRQAEAPHTSRVTSDGAILLFTSSANLTKYDSHDTPELYRYREGQGILCVSCNPTGAPPQGRPSFGDSIGLSFLTPSSPAPTLTRNLSASGDRVFFESTDALLPEDTNDPGGCPQTGPFNGAYPSCLSVYEWEAEGSGSCGSKAEDGGCLYLLSPPGDTGASFLGDASASGDDVFLFARAPLVSQDTDRLLDLYDARVGGGLAAQNQLSITPCEGAEACHGQTSSPADQPQPATPNFRGPPNPIAKPCPKGTVRRNHRCVGKHAKKHKPHKRGKHSKGRSHR